MPTVRRYGLIFGLILAGGGWTAAEPARTVAEIVIAKGLELRQALAPIDIPADWPGYPRAERDRILRDVRAALDERDERTVSRLTAASGPAGADCEACYAAWLVTGYWLAHGETFAEIAEVKQQDATARVAEAIDGLLTQSPSR